MRVVCTAGHVDHGKTTLVTALTGQQPDRLAEEQRRGLTIDLGFAWTELPDVGAVAFVDLPGHERFVPNMLAGAGPVSVALFVVAADEGWMPQSEEHLGILNLLEVRRGVVALTRADLVDDETAAIAAELVGDSLAGSCLATAEVVAVSATSGQGIPDLRQALRRCLLAAPPAPDLGRPRLWVDRSFSVRGAGTVVTGTLLGGRIRTGDMLSVMPGGAPGRVRGMQALEQPVEEVLPGWRVALNLAGVDSGEVGRGDAVTGQDWRSTVVVDAWCQPVAGHVLGRRGAWMAHVGTAAVPARLIPLGGKDLVESGPIRIELDRPLPLAMGDRIVLREAGRGITAGGGVVIDPAPGQRVRGAPARRARHAALLAVGTPRGATERLAGLVQLRGATASTSAMVAANAPAHAVADAEVEVVGPFLLSHERWMTWSGLAMEAVRSEHQRRPARAAVSRDHPRRLLRQADCATDVAEAILTQLVTRGALAVIPGGVAVPGHEPRLTVAQQAARTALLHSLDAAGASPPPLGELAAVAKADADLIDALRADGQLLDLPGLPDVVVSGDMVRTLVAQLVDLQARVGPFTAAQARDVWATSRRFALPLLELLDARGDTARDGDLRVTSAAVS